LKEITGFIRETPLGIIFTGSCIVRITMVSSGILSGVILGGMLSWAYVEVLQNNRASAPEIQRFLLDFIQALI
jgi:hypothetical protein